MVAFGFCYFNRSSAFRIKWSALRGPLIGSRDWKLQIDSAFASRHRPQRWCRFTQDSFWTNLEREDQSIRLSPSPD
jgi:hypothetical protein